MAPSLLTRFQNVTHRWNRKSLYFHFAPLSGPTDAYLRTYAYWTKVAQIFARLSDTLTITPIPLSEIQHFRLVKYAYFALVEFQMPFFYL